MSRLRNLLGLALVLMVSTGICGCASDRESTQGNSDSDPLTFDDKGKLVIPNGGSRVKGENACRHARVKLGVDEEIIEFTAYCSGHKQDKVFFTVQRISLKDPADTLEIDGFSSDPVVRGEGGPRMRGKCSMLDEILACNATIDGPVMISGDLVIKSGSPCEGAIAVVGITSPPCQGNYCTGDPILDELFYARPEGCGAGGA